MRTGFILGRLLWQLSLVLLLLLAFAMCCRSQAQSGPGSIGPPRSAFFGGLGFGINAVNFAHQSLVAVGTSQNYEDGALISAGVAGGSGFVDTTTETTASPEIRLGYYRHIGRSPWLWGFEGSYADLLAEATQEDVSIPQTGVIAYASTQSESPFTGLAIAQSERVTADSHFSAGPFIGYSLGPGFIYLGLGGTMTHAETDLNNLVGYAYVGGQSVDVSGAPQSFTRSGWVLGGNATIGGNYFVTKNWFLDIAYRFAETAAQLGRYVSSFTNSVTNQGVTTTGTLYGQSSEKIITNSMTLTINRAF
jgi:opacity protein-like surface antigen